MKEIDFITAFGRLLSDGRLRAAFVNDPEAIAKQIHLRPEDWSAWLQLVPGQLEIQSRMLLHKRLDLLRQLLPETARRLGARLLPYYLECTSMPRLGGESTLVGCAFHFCQWLRQRDGRLVARAEWNRVKFAFSKMPLAIHWTDRSKAHGCHLPAIQILFRMRSNRWYELFLGFRF